MSETPEIPQEAVTSAEAFEGYSARPYRDPAGIWTIGYGSTRDALGHAVTAATPPITKAIAEGLMRRDLTVAATTISGSVRVPLNDDERGALIDFVYNVGAGNFNASTLLRLLNAGNYEGAAGQFALWDHAGGQVLAGLLRRRLAEKAEFLKGRQAQVATPKEPTNA